MSKGLNLRNQHPMQLIDRMLRLQALKEIGAEKINMLEKKFHVFIMEEYDEDNNMTLVIDWEFAIFHATSHQYEQLIANFVPKQPTEESKDTPTSNLILPDTELDKGDRPGLIIT